MSETTSKQKTDTEKGAEGKPTGAEKAAADQAAEVQNVVDSDPRAVNPRVAENGVTTAGQGDAAVLIKADGTVEGKFYSDATSEQFVTLEQDVIEEFYFPLTARPAYRVLFTKGQRVQKSAIDAYNAATEAANARKAGTEEGVADYVDSTTYASGTDGKVPGVTAK